MRPSVRRTLRRLGRERIVAPDESAAGRSSELAEAILRLTPPAPGVVTVLDASRHRRLEPDELDALRLASLRFAGSDRRLIATGVAPDLRHQLIAAGLADLLRRDIAHDARVIVVHVPPRPSQREV